jgi:hypothetical protein
MESIADVVALGSVVDGVKRLVELLNAKASFEFMFEDLRASWHLITALLVGGALASLLWISLVRCFAGIMVWLSLVGTMLVLGFGGNHLHSPS